MKKIRVLQLGSCSGLYGAERWILALIKYLDPARVESWVGSIRDTPERPVPVCREAAALGFDTQVFDSHGTLSLSAVTLLRDFIREQGIDILHSHGYKTDLIGLLATAGTGCKIMTTPHGWTKHPDLKLLGYELLDRMAFPFFDAVVPLSDGLCRPLRRIPLLKHKVHLINNGVDTGEIESAQGSAKEIAAWKAAGSFVIGYVGRLTAGKGLDVLLRSIAAHGEPHWRVALVGEGEQEAELKAMVRRLQLEDSVRFFGFRPDRLLFMKAFDVFVLPSRSEGTPRCIMEAMVAGVPVVASDIPGCRCLITNQKTGLFFPMDNAAMLADSLRLLESRPHLKDELCAAAKTFIHAHYSAAKMADEYTSLYAAVCRDKQG